MRVKFKSIELLLSIAMILVACNRCFVCAHQTIMWNMASWYFPYRSWWNVLICIENVQFLFCYFLHAFTLDLIDWLTQINCMQTSWFHHRCQTNIFMFSIKLNDFSSSIYIKYHFSIVKYSTWSEVEKWKQKFSLFITSLQLYCFSARAHQINVRRNNKISIEALVYCFSKSIFNCKFQWLFYALLDPAP